jgi:predicted hotdog family 3-hydroxylacyl-ACP dehydratase
MLIDKHTILEVIPQRAPFVMIDCLESANSEGFLSHFHIESTNIFLHDRQLSESALVENIAQTCAAGFGFLGRSDDQEEPRIGFIGDVTKLEVLGKATETDTIDTQITILNTFENIHLIEGVARSSGKDLLKCQMKIVLA